MSQLPQRHVVPNTVYLLLETVDSVTNVLGVFADIQDANQECLRRAALAGVTLTTDFQTMGPDPAHHYPIEPMRWDTPEGDCCYVEMFAVAPKRVVAAPMLAPGSV